jgi:hypothetical protein
MSLKRGLKEYFWDSKTLLQSDLDPFYKRSGSDFLRNCCSGCGSWYGSLYSGIRAVWAHDSTFSGRIRNRQPFGIRSGFHKKILFQNIFVILKSFNPTGSRPFYKRSGSGFLRTAVAVADPYMAHSMQESGPAEPMIPPLVDRSAITGHSGFRSDPHKKGLIKNRPLSDTDSGSAWTVSLYAGVRAVWALDFTFWGPFEQIQNEYPI